LRGMASYEPLQTCENVYSSSFILIHPVMLFCITNKGNTPSSTTLSCHITLCCLFQ